MNYINYSKLLFCIIVLCIVLYLYFNSRSKGCMDNTAINYNPNANLHQVDACIYPVLGCTDPNAVNYNKWANTSCFQDCNSNLNKFDAKCEFTQDCSSLPEHICQYRTSGCSRKWTHGGLVVDDVANIDDNSCLTTDSFMSRIIILSGGSCDGCDDTLYVKIDDKYVIEGGAQGLTVIVLDRNLTSVSQINVKYIKNFNVGVAEQDSQDFVTFANSSISLTDIVIFVSKGDMIGQFQISTKYLQQIISTDAQQFLKKLGAKHAEIIPKTSYIFIGTIMLDIYFESANPNKNSYFPLLNLVKIGNINMYDPKFIKTKMPPSKHRLLTSESLDPYRCALEAYSIGVDVFNIYDGECYAVTDQVLSDSNSINKFDKTNYVRSYMLNNYVVYDRSDSLIPGNIQPDSIDSEVYYVIVNAYTSSYYLHDFGKMHAYIYSGPMMTGLETQLEEGIQPSTKIFSSRETATANGGFEILNVTSLKIPSYFYLIAYKTMYSDPILNDPNVSEYKLFSGPNKTTSSFKEYPDIQKAGYVSTISYFNVINGYGGIVLFEKPNYDGLALKVTHGKTIIDSSYTKPFFWKIQKIISFILQDLNIKNLFTDKNGNDITYDKLIKLFQDQLPLNEDQFKKMLFTLLQNVPLTSNYNDVNTYVDKCMKKVIGLPIGSFKASCKASSTIRFFDTIDCSNQLYMHKVQMKSDDEVSDLTSNITSLVRAIIVDKIGYIQIISEINDPNYYKTVTYHDISSNNNASNLQIQSFAENDQSNLQLKTYDWSATVGIPISNDANVIKLIDSTNNQIDEFHIDSNQNHQIWKDRLNAVMSPLTLEINHVNNFKQIYNFVNINGVVQFQAGLRIISVTAGSWKITFEHDASSTILYIPCAASGIVTLYDRSVYDGVTIINYKNDVIINTITVDKNNVLSEHAHLVNIKISTNEQIYVEYIYDVSRWTIKMPYNLPTKTINWQRYYGK